MGRTKVSLMSGRALYKKYRNTRVVYLKPRDKSCNIWRTRLKIHPAWIALYYVAWNSLLFFAHSHNASWCTFVSVSLATESCRNIIHRYVLKNRRYNILEMWERAVLNNVEGKMEGNINIHLHQSTGADQFSLSIIWHHVMILCIIIIWYAPSIHYGKCTTRRYDIHYCFTSGVLFYCQCALFHCHNIPRAGESCNSCSSSKKVSERDFLHILCIICCYINLNFIKLLKPVGNRIYEYV